MLFLLYNHSFLPGDIILLRDLCLDAHVTIGQRYVVLEVGFRNVRVIDDYGNSAWAAADAFDHTPKVTIVRGHLKRIVFGR